MLRFDIKTVRKYFFDRKTIKRKVDTRTRKVLSKFGSFVRRSARHSIRPSKRTSQPGRPPFSHSGKLRQHIFFVYDPNRRSVVIGPVIYPKKSGKALPALEYGGRSDTEDGTIVKIRARPFMGPAFTANRLYLKSLSRGIYNFTGGTTHLVLEDTLRHTSVTGASLGKLLDLRVTSGTLGDGNAAGIMMTSIYYAVNGAVYNERMAAVACQRAIVTEILRLREPGRPTTCWNPCPTWTFGHLPGNAFFLCQIYSSVHRHAD